MGQVFVLGINKQPLNPIRPGRARILLSKGQAAVFKHYPFSIRMDSKASGAFTITTARGVVTDIGHRYCTLIQRHDGYGSIYAKGGRDFLPTL